MAWLSPRLVPWERTILCGVLRSDHPSKTSLRKGCHLALAGQLGWVRVQSGHTQGSTNGRINTWNNRSMLLSQINNKNRYKCCHLSSLSGHLFPARNLTESQHKFRREGGRLATCEAQNFSLGRAWGGLGAEEGYGGLVLQLTGCIWGYFGGGALNLQDTFLGSAPDCPWREGRRKQPLLCVCCRSLRSLVNSHFLFPSRALGRRQ